MVGWFVMWHLLESDRDLDRLPLSESDWSAHGVDVDGAAREYRSVVQSWERPDGAVWWDSASVWLVSADDVVIERATDRDGHVDLWGALADGSVTVHLSRVVSGELVRARQAAAS